jgi:hypothetical protein
MTDDNIPRVAWRRDPRGATVYCPDLQPDFARVICEVEEDDAVCIVEFLNAMPLVRQAFLDGTETVWL